MAATGYRTQAELAEAVEVDVRTVGRWLKAGANSASARAKLDALGPRPAFVGKFAEYQAQELRTLEEGAGGGTERVQAAPEGIAALQVRGPVDVEPLQGRPARRPARSGMRSFRFISLAVFAVALAQLLLMLASFVKGGR